MTIGRAIALATGAALVVGLHVGVSRAADAVEAKGVARGTVAAALIGIGLVGTLIAARVHG